MILVLGKNGQVGGALAKLLGDDAVASDSSSINLLQPDFLDRLTATAERHEITTLINAAAYTQVDKAEQERDHAMQINGKAVGQLAEWCKKHDVTLVHYSTDYVFDGSGNAPRKEIDNVSPINSYGESKLLGERLIAASGVDHLIFRTSWVYDETGNNYLNTMLRLFKEREELKVVNDQVGAPTYAKHLAVATLTALKAAQNAPAFPSGVYHLCGGAETSWYGFAKAILALASKHESGIKCQNIQPITTDEYPTPARRPLNSRLDCTKAKEILGVSLAHWQDALNECYENIRRST